MTESWDGTVEQTAYRLAVSEAEAKQALIRMERLGYFSFADGKYTLLQRTLIKTPHGQPSAAIRKAHKQYLRLAEKALEMVPVELRNFNTLTIAVDPSRLAEADKEIQSFKKRMCEIMQSGAQKEVYTLSIQLFPISRPGKA